MVADSAYKIKKLSFLLLKLSATSVKNIQDLYLEIIINSFEWGSVLYKDIAQNNQF